MYKYKIGYGTCEENSFVELEHEKKFKKKEVTQMVAEAIEALFPDKINDDVKTESGEYYEFAFKFDQFWRDGLSKSNIIDWLIENKGFKPIEYELVWSAWGWASVLDPKDWKMYRKNNDELAQITKYLNSKGITQEKFPFENWEKKLKKDIS